MDLDKSDSLPIDLKSIIYLWFQFLKFLHIRIY